MRKSWIDNTFWIVRSAGERTTESCVALIREFVPPEQVRVIQERPFAAAIRKTYELGAASGRKWTVCIDADVFIHREGFRQLVGIAERVPGWIWYVQGLTIDKFIPIIRSAGTGIYRNARVLEAIEGIPPDGSSLRPETTTMQAMIARGHLMYRTPIVVGMHDFEQSYHDIARKTFLHIHKHANVRAEMLGYWRKQRSKDADFRAALLGARLGESFGGDLLIDREFKRREIDRAMADAGLVEKPPLAPGAIDPDYVASYSRGFRPDSFLQQKKFPQYRRTSLMSPPERFYKRWRRQLQLRIRGLR